MSIVAGTGAGPGADPGPPVGTVDPDSTLRTADPGTTIGAVDTGTTAAPVDPGTTIDTADPGTTVGTADPDDPDRAAHQDDRRPVHPAPVRPPRTLAAAGDLLRALAAPVRIAIVLQLRESSHCVHDLVDALGVAQPLISQHLRVLKTAGVVSGTRQGREVMYALVDDHLAHIVADAVAHAEEGR